MKNDTMVSVIICFTNETMTFITMICFKLCSVMRLSYMWCSCMIHAHFNIVIVAQSLVFYVVLCKSFIVLASFLLWPLYCLSFFHKRLLITLLVSSICSWWRCRVNLTNCCIILNACLYDVLLTQSFKLVLDLSTSHKL